MTEKLCALHRQHLRILAGYRWPKRIRNEENVQTDKVQTPLNRHTAIQTMPPWTLPWYAY